MIPLIFVLCLGSCLPSDSKVAPVNAETPQKEYLKLTKLDSTGIISWEFKTDKKGVSFLIQTDLNIDKPWDAYKSVDVSLDSLKKNDSGYYTVSSSVLFFKENMGFRIKAIGFVKDTVSNTIVINYKNPWLTDDLSHKQEDIIILKYPTHYRVFDQYGKLLIEGNGNKIVFSGLPIGVYYLDAANFANEYSYRN